MNRILLFTAALALVVGGCSSSETAVAPEAEAEAAPAGPDYDVVDYDVEDLDYPALRDFQVPEPERVELPNGMVVFLIEDRELPTVSMQARIGGGSVYEPADHVGLAGITGTVMRTGGTEALTPDELNLALENVGATVETYFGETSGGAYMTTLERHLDTVLPLFVDVLTNPRFEQEKVDLAVSQAKASIARRNDDPQSIAFREFAQVLYGEDSPYARVPEYYTLDEITRDDVVAFHDEFVVPQNTMLAVWGDFDAAAMADQLREAFAGWEGPDSFQQPEPPAVTATDDEPGVYVVEKNDVTQSTILMGYLGELTRDDPDYFPVLVMNEVLSGGFTSRLFNSVRTDLGLAYAVFGSYGAGYETVEPFQAGVFTKTETTGQAARAVRREIERMREAPPTEEEVQLAKDAYLNSFVFNFDTRQEIVNRLMAFEAYGYPSTFLTQTQQGVEAVTPEDVHRVAQQYLHPKGMSLLLLGQVEGFDEAPEALANGRPVERLDISIPTSAPGEEDAVPEMTEESRASGRELLTAAADALGGAAAFQNLQNYRYEQTQQAQTPQGEMEVSVDVLISNDDRFRVERGTPQGTITIVLTPEGARAQTPMGIQDLPPPVTQQVRAQVWNDLTYLLMNADEVDAQALGMQEVDGQQLEAVRLLPPDAQAVTLYLDPETRQPVRMEYDSVSQQGTPVTNVEVFEDFAEADGLRLPTRTVVYQDGEVAATSVTDRITVNAELAADAFEL